MEAINRKVDGLGRVVLPFELRKATGIAENDELKMYAENNKIILERVPKINRLDNIILASKIYSNTK